MPRCVTSCCCRRTRTFDAKGPPPRGDGPMITGDPSTSGSARSGSGRCRVACRCRLGVTLASFQAIAKERLTTAGRRCCGPGARSRGRGFRKTCSTETFVCAGRVGAGSLGLIEVGFAVAGTRTGRRSQCDSGRTRTGGGVSSGLEGWGRTMARRPGEASASSHSPGCDTATCKSGDEVSHIALPFVVSCCDGRLIRGHEMIRKRNLRQPAAVSAMLPWRHTVAREP